MFFICQSESYRALYDIRRELRILVNIASLAQMYGDSVDSAQSLDSLIRAEHLAELMPRVLEWENSNCRDDSNAVAALDLADFKATVIYPYLATEFLDYGDFTTAETYLQRAVEDAEKELASSLEDEHEGWCFRLIIRLLKLLAIYESQSDHANAIRLITKIDSVLERSRNPSTRMVANRKVGDYLLYYQAIMAFEGLRNNVLRQDDRRIGMKEHKQLPYDAAIQLAFQLGRMSTMFELTALSKSRELLKLLSQNVRMTEDVPEPLSKKESELFVQLMGREIGNGGSL